jgi:hypothetical protein
MMTPIPIELISGELSGGAALLKRLHDQIKPFDLMKMALKNLTIEQLNELSQEIRKARKRLKYEQFQGEVTMKQIPTLEVSKDLTYISGPEIVTITKEEFLKLHEDGVGPHDVG